MAARKVPKKLLIIRPRAREGDGNGPRLPGVPAFEPVANSDLHPALRKILADSQLFFHKLRSKNAGFLEVRDQFARFARSGLDASPVLSAEPKSWLDEELEAESRDARPSVAELAFLAEMRPLKRPEAAGVKSALDHLSKSVRKIESLEGRLNGRESEEDRAALLRFYSSRHSLFKALLDGQPSQAFLSKPEA